MNIVFVNGLIYWIFQIYQYLIIAYVIMSWLPQVRESPIGEIIGKLVEPYLRIFRKFIPPLGMIDISPIVALFALYFIELGVSVIVDFIGGFFNVI